MSDEKLRAELNESIIRAELRARELQLDDHATAAQKSEAFVRLGELRRMRDDLDRDNREVKLSLDQQVIDTAARRYLEVARQLTEFAGRPNVAADVDLLTEELDRLWATLGEEGQEWVQRYAPKVRPRR